MSDEFRKGERIRHLQKPEWGLGQVLEDSRGDSVRVFFVEVGEKVLSLKYAKLKKVSAADAAHPILDNLQISGTTSGIKYRSLSESKKYFLDRFPNGFYDDNYLDMERNYKVAAHELATELLNKQEFMSLVENGNFDELCNRCLRVLNSTNLVFPNEKMALKDGLINSDAKEAFSNSLYDFLYGAGALEVRFAKFVSILEDIAADKWTTASYFLFVVSPDKYMFVKPTITQHAAELCRYAINYRPQLNWLTYKTILEFADYLRAELSDLKPRDMIDIQSFMWCIAPHS